jgi:hypothetical protein
VSKDRALVRSRHSFPETEPFPTNSTKNKAFYLSFSQFKEPFVYFIIIVIIILFLFLKKMVNILFTLFVKVLLLMVVKTRAVAVQKVSQSQQVSTQARVDENADHSLLFSFY